MKPTLRQGDPQPHRNAAFTRADLLAIVVTLAMGVFAVLPALGQAKAKSRRVQCLSNQEGIGRAFRQFAFDHQNRFPMQVSTNEGGSAEYLGSQNTAGAVDTWRHFWALRNELSTHRILICPTDLGRYEPTDWDDFAWRVTAKNGAISYGVGTGAQPGNPRMLLIADRSMVGRVGTLNIEFNSRATRLNLGTNAQALATLSWDARGMHQAAGNITRADGTVHLLTSERLRAALIESGDSRNNYAQPGLSGVR